MAENKPKMTDAQLFADLSDAQLVELMMVVVRFQVEEAKGEGEQEASREAVAHIATELLRRKAACRE